MKKIIPLLLSGAMLLPMLVACGTNAPDKAIASDTTTAAITTKTPETVTIDPIIVEKDYKTVALEYTKMMINDYYDLRGGRLNTTPGGGQAVVWGVGAFAETLTEAYRLAPKDETIRSAYLMMLNTTIQQYRASLNTRDGKIYYYNASAGNSGDFYYDDNEWIALVYMEAYQMLNDAKYLTYAEEILELIWHGWDTENGGVHWKGDNSGPTTCSNGPAIIAYATHYQLTGNETSLTRAKTIYDWVRDTKNMREGNLYKDSKGNGWKANYNQGTMIYSGALLYEITGEKDYLRYTRLTVQSTLGTAFKKGRDGYTDFDNDIENPWMNGWYIRGLMKYFEQDPDKETKYLEAAAEVMAVALSKQQDRGGYIPNDFGNTDGSIDKDIVKQAGIPTLFALLAHWQETWDGVQY
ncbi:MAG: glycoside hydrolase family 76 protein [Eubacteriales bacterium]